MNPRAPCSPEAHDTRCRESGAVATEYSIVAALITLGILVGAGALGSSLDGFYSAIEQAVVTYFPVIS